MFTLGFLIDHMKQLPKELPQSAVEMQCPMRIEMLEKQEILRSDRLYLGERMPVKATIEPGTMIFLAGYREMLIRDKNAHRDKLQWVKTTYSTENGFSVPENAVLLKFSCSLAKLYNSVAAALDEIEQEEKSKTDRSPDAFRRCWQDIADRRITGNQQIREEIARTGFPLKSFVRPAVITFTGDPNAASRAELMTKLQELFPDVNIMEWQKEVLLFLTYSERSFHIELPEENLSELLGQYDAWLCVGNGTRNLTVLPLLFNLSRQGSTLGRKLELYKGQRIFLLEEYSVYCAIDLCAQHYMQIHRSDDIIYLVHPAVIHLTRYDMEHNTNLRDVLFYYLRNDRNLLKTSAETFMHRNTVINKVKRIQELVDLDLEDGRLRQRLIFSCQVIRYYENVLKLRLKL